jgi:tRNA 2-thiocytidine biosynthesis protein TtcA
MTGNTFPNKKSKSAKLTRHLLYRFSSAVRDYNMIEDGDHVMVCHSGGKDSFALLELITAYQKKAPEKFTIVVVNLDQNFPGYPKNLLPDYFEGSDILFQVIEQNIYGVIKDKISDGKNVCSLCSRLRRGALYNFAQKNGVTKIAMGHHKNDMVETLFLNMFYGGRLKSMPPKLLTDSEAFVVIRPMAYIHEKDLSRYADVMGFPIISDHLCGVAENKQRKIIKQMVNEWSRQFPGRLETVFKSTQQVALSQLADFDAYDFKNLRQKNK